MPKRLYMPDEFDYLAVYIIPRDVWDIIPSAEICRHTAHAIQLLDPRRGRGKYRPYLEAWHLLMNRPVVRGHSDKDKVVARASR